MRKKRATGAFPFTSHWPTTGASWLLIAYDLRADRDTLCTDKDDTVVRYSVLSESQQLFASKYRLVLPSEEELRDELERRQIL